MKTLANSNLSTTLVTPDEVVALDTGRRHS